MVRSAPPSVVRPLPIWLPEWKEDFHALNHLLHRVAVLSVPNPARWRSPARRAQPRKEPRNGRPEEGSGRPRAGDDRQVRDRPGAARHVLPGGNALPSAGGYGVREGRATTAHGLI